MPITPFKPQQSSLPNGTPKQLYELYYNTQIAPDGPDGASNINTAIINATGNYNADSDNKTSSHEVAVGAAQYYQTSLMNESDIKKSLLDEKNAHLQYTMLAMTIWVPLGIFAGYYLYSRGSNTGSV